MRVVVVGTDPAGLYLACLLKSREPDREVRVIDTGAPDRKAAPPHVLVNPVKPELKLADAELQAAVMGAAARSRGVLIRREGEVVATAGQPYALIEAAALVAILREAAAARGCEIVSATDDDAAALAGADLVVIADGAESSHRGVLAGRFQPVLTASKTRHVVLDASVEAAQPTFLFRGTPGGIFHGLHVPSGSGRSVLIIEAPKAAVIAAGLENAPAADIAAFCARLFAGDLAGARLTPRSDAWRPFVSVRNQTWTADNMVLLGAAAYNAHFSVGLGARSGLEDAEVLATLLDARSGLADALRKFEAARRPRAESLLRAATASQAWFEHTYRYIGMPLAQFAYSCLTRSMRLNHENMRLLAPELTEAVDLLIAGPARTRSNTPPPPMFTPITLRGVTFPNRIVMSPMCMYNADDGTVGDFHLVHYGSRAVGGTGLLITEMTDVSPEGRISAHCAGLYKPEHVAAWRRVTDFVHQRTGARIGVQLGHSGRKGGTARPWERGGARQPAWATMAPSPIPFEKDGPAPREMTRADMDRLVAAYANAARMAHEAGFDLIELHFAHGYLLSTFISPLSNTRTDKYGGSLANRLRFPMEVFEAVRAAFPADKPLSVRISAVDWHEQGTSIADAIAIGRVLKEAGNDVLSVSTGGVLADRRPNAGRLFHATFSDQVRNELGIPTMTVGGVASHGDINTMIAAGRADMCAMGRGQLFDPYFARHAAYQQSYKDLPWPPEYERAATFDLPDLQ